MYWQWTICPRRLLYQIFANISLLFLVFEGWIGRDGSVRTLWKKSSDLMSLITEDWPYCTTKIAILTLRLWRNTNGAKKNGALAVDQPQVARVTRSNLRPWMKKSSPPKKTRQITGWSKHKLEQSDYRAMVVSSILLGAQCVLHFSFLSIFLIFLTS